MRKEFVVMRIDAAPDGAPYVLVTLSLAKDMAEGNQPPNPSTTNVMGFSNMDDMMKNLNKMISGGGMPGMMGGAAPGTTSIKLDMHEYKQLGLSVGDKVNLDISKSEISIIFMGDKSDEMVQNLKMELDIYKEKIKSIFSKKKN